MSHSSIIVSVLIVLNTVALVSCVSCPVWFVYNSTAGKCECGRKVGEKILECSNFSNLTKIQYGFCLTFDNSTNTEYFGECPYNTRSSLLGSSVLPYDVSQLNKAMCGPLNRTGLLCSRCEPGLGPAVLSKFRKCKKCLEIWLGCILLLLRITVPATILCVIVVVLHVNIGSPALNIFVLTAHQISNLFNTNPFLLYRHNFLLQKYSFEKFVVDVYSLFSLDFFNFGFPTFCIKENMSMLTVLSLDYIVAIYPLFFIALVYGCITIHDSGKCRLAVICWRPFKSCLSSCRNGCNVKGSVINAFTTLYIFSFNKICFTSLYLIQVTQVWNKTGSSSVHSYFDAQYEVYSWEYITSATLASCIIVCVIIGPVVFIFLQSTRFRNCLSRCGIKIVLIREMVVLLQSGFKDGVSTGTQDYRWFAGLYLLLRVPFLYLFDQNYRSTLYVCLYSILAVLVTALRPYKVQRYNIVDSIVWLVSVIAIAWYNYFKDNDIHWHGMLYIIGSYPFAYALFNGCLAGVSFLIKWKRSVNQPRVLIPVPDENTNILPDRLLNPRRYCSLDK